MCNPLAMAGVSALISAAGTAVSVDQNVKTAEAQMQAAEDAAYQDKLALNAQLEEENAAVRQQQFERMRQGMREQATLAVAMGEANMAGNTPLRELSNVMAQVDYDLSIMESNRENMEEQNARGVQKVNSTMQGRMNTAKASAGSAWSNGLQIGASGVQGAVSGYQMGQSLQGRQKS